MEPLVIIYRASGVSDLLLDFRLMLREFFAEILYDFPMKFYYYFTTAFKKMSIKLVKNSKKHRTTA